MFREGALRQVLVTLSEPVEQEDLTRAAVILDGLMAGRTEFVLTALAGTTVLTTPLSRLPRRRDRVAVTLLMLCVVSQVAVWPFLAPAFNRAELEAIKTRIDPEGVCLQNTDYTCGPAAAVTALR